MEQLRPQARLEKFRELDTPALETKNYKPISRPSGRAYHHADCPGDGPYCPHDNYETSTIHPFLALISKSRFGKDVPPPCSTSFRIKQTGDHALTALFHATLASLRGLIPRYRSAQRTAHFRYSELPARIQRIRDHLPTISALRRDSFSITAS